MALALKVAREDDHGHRELLRVSNQGIYFLAATHSPSVFLPLELSWNLEVCPVRPTDGDASSVLRHVSCLDASLRARMRLVT